MNRASALTHNLVSLGKVAAPSKLRSMAKPTQLPETGRSMHAHKSNGPAPRV